MTRNFDDEFLNDFLDGNLSGEELARAERLMLEDANFREQVDSWRAISRQCQTMPKCSLPAGFADLIVSRAFVSPPLTDAPVSQGSTGPSATSKGMNPPGKNTIRWSPLLYAGALAASLLLGIFFFAWNREPGRHLALQNNSTEQGEIVNGRLRPVPFENLEAPEDEATPSTADEGRLRAEIQASDGDDKAERDGRYSAAPKVAETKRTPRPNAAIGGENVPESSPAPPRIISGGMAQSDGASGMGGGMGGMAASGPGGMPEKSAARSANSATEDKAESGEEQSITGRLNGQRIPIGDAYSEVWILELAINETGEAEETEQLSMLGMLSKSADGRYTEEIEALKIDPNQPSLFDVSGSSEELAKLKGSIEEAFPIAKLESLTRGPDKLDASPDETLSQGGERVELKKSDTSKPVPPSDTQLHIKFLGHQTMDQSFFEQFKPSTDNKSLAFGQQETPQRERPSVGTGFGGDDSRQKSDETRMIAGGRSSKAGGDQQQAEEKTKVVPLHAGQPVNPRRILLIIKPRS